MIAEIAALDFAVPPAVQTAEQLAPLIGRSPEWIETNAGVSKRHCCHGYQDDPAKFVAELAKPIIDEHGKPDLVLHAGAMTRQLIPDTSVFVARELGLKAVPAFTVNATCLSALAAMQTANALIATEQYHRVLICVSEFGTPGRNFKEPESAALIGDAAAVILLQASQRDAGLQHYAMATWPEGAELAEVRGGGVHCPPHVASAADNLFHMQGENLLRFVLPRLVKFLKQFCSDAGISLDELDLVVPHQASAAGLKILERLGIPDDKTVKIIADYGNCGAASIPMALSIAEQQSRIRSGDQILLLGTAAGVSIGAALLKW
ncbi:MAG: ketoacyl-ACP synthase III [Planctomycetota bacterium]